MNKTTSLGPDLQDFQERIVAQLETCLPDPNNPPKALHRAMRYAVLNGGKRLRPLLIYATGKALGVPISSLDPPAMAIELIHCYSLVHDDLPGMDDSDIRRSQPTCHKAFNEATAILVGDALQSLAFACLPNISMVHALASASGSAGMAGGQSLDLEASTMAATTISLTALERMHSLKTGALIEACIKMAIIAADCKDPFTTTSLQQFARYIGIAFQIQDDILDVQGQEETLGKTPGIDAAHAKATYTSLLGITGAQQQLQTQYNRAITALKGLKLNTKSLEQLCHYVIQRKN